MRGKGLLVSIVVGPLLLSGCIEWGGDDDDDEATTAALAGIYSGSSGWTGHITEWGGVTLITETGDTVALLSDGTYLRGTLSRSGERLYGSASLWTGQLIWSTGTIAGYVDNHGVLQGDLILADRHAVPFVFESMERLYDRRRGLELLEGVWTDWDASQGPQTTLTVEPDGTLTGSNSQGCFFSGAISYPLRERNLHRVTVKVSNCASPAPGSSVPAELGGLHTGLAFHLPDGITNRG